jgi:hypothetical protein
MTDRKGEGTIGQSIERMMRREKETCRTLESKGAQGSRG